MEKVFIIKQNKQSGFIGTIILIVVFLLILHFMGITITGVLNWIWSILVWIWDLFLSVL